MARITLIRPPMIATKRAYSVVMVPPLGPAYVAAAPRSAGHEVTFIDALGEDPDGRHAAAHSALVAYGLTIPEIVDRIPADTQGIGMSVMFSQQWPHVDELARLADEWRPDLKRLEQLQSTSQMSQREYAESWAFVHYLLESSPENRTLLRDHLQALVRSTPHPPLSDELERLVDSGEYAVAFSMHPTSMDDTA